ncbi:alpha/beta hydrolase [Nocardia sp. BSTN01]|uniref:alpha/beta hydrolase n=1 Tax=Nocardia sp. BSTN01 TaxID=2783665 RepID=UPI00188FA54A|nr:alpha/beta hydrolase [Nocardia sp. BSTN01]MBF4996972.1 alpha/beta hydrolase [Nocardia sp. BSTN01]
MTTTQAHPATGVWDEPEGATPRGTVILLPGRGETAGSYGRLGRRLSADGYRVRYVPVALDDFAGTRAAVEKVLADESLPAPRILLGSDSGATLAARLVSDIPVEGAVLAAIALPSPAPRSSSTDAVGTEWADEVDARTACPVHRATISADGEFTRGAIALPVPWQTVAIGAHDRPTLALHGTDDRITPLAAAIDAYTQAPRTDLRLVRGGRHDVLNDVAHRSVAATIVLFLESLRLGAEVPPIVTPKL